MSPISSAMVRGIVVGLNMVTIHVQIQSQKFIKLLIIVFEQFSIRRKIWLNQEHHAPTIDHRLCFCFYQFSTSSFSPRIFFPFRLIPGQISTTATSISASNTKNYAVSLDRFINITSMQMMCRKKCICLKEQVCLSHVQFIIN